MSNHIRIVFLIDIMDNSSFWGGAELHVADVMQNLDVRRFDIYCASDNSEYGEFIKSASSGKVAFYQLRKKYKLYCDPFYFFDIIRILRKIRPDILHTHKLKSAIWGRIAGRLAGVPLIVSTLHGAPSFWTYGKFRNALNKFANAITARLCSNINIALSELESETLQKNDWIPASRIVVIHNGIFNLKSFAGKNRAQIHRSPQIISVGRLNWEKRHADLIASMPAILQKFPHATLKIIGDGVERGNLQSMSARLGISDKVAFSGFINRKQLPDFLANADVFVLSSLWEAFPYAVIEAMASGLPVVATRVGGIPEILAENRGGLLVTPMNPHEISTAVISLLKNNEMREKFGQFNKRRAISRFNGNIMMKALTDVYTQNLRIS